METESTLRGHLIAFEGMDGVGKSTAIQGVAEALRSVGWEVTTLREPGGTQAGEMCRDILKSDVPLDPRAEALVFSAARAQIVAEVIKPALAAGKLVLVDRWVTSSLAYQGVARGLGVEAVREVNEFAMNGTQADRVLLLELSPEEAERRRAAREEEQDDARFEESAFQRKVHVAYDTLAQSDESIVRVNADGSPLDVQVRCLDALADLLDLDGF